MTHEEVGKVIGNNDKDREEKLPVPPRSAVGALKSGSRSVVVEWGINRLTYWLIWLLGCELIGGIIYTLFHWLGN